MDIKAAALQVQPPIHTRAALSGVVLNHSCPICNRLHSTAIRHFSLPASIPALHRAKLQDDLQFRAGAVQFPLAHPRVASIIPGSANAAEAAENKKLLDTLLPKGLVQTPANPTLVISELDLISRFDFERSC